MSLARSLARALFDRIPADIDLVLRFCERYVDRHYGDNDSDPARNGEMLLLRTEMGKLRNGCVFDVGANVGHWAEAVLRIEPSIRLHCFEPSAATFGQLAAKQWPPTVRLNPVGLGAEAGELELQVVEQGSGLNSLYVRHGVESARVAASERIRIVTIDAYCEELGVPRIDFLKIDVEGHELAVFKGMRRMLAQGRIAAIQFEYGGTNLDARVYLQDIWEFLKPFGFNFYKLFADGPRLVPEYRQSMETFKYANYVARKEPRS